jgi:carnosine N-methyltransferase
LECWGRDLMVLRVKYWLIAPTVQGRDERDACYQPMIQALNTHFTNKTDDERFVSSLKKFHDLTLLSGSSSAFLCLEPALGVLLMTLLVPVSCTSCRFASNNSIVGYGCQGNEFSHYMCAYCAQLWGILKQLWFHSNCFVLYPEPVGWHFLWFKYATTLPDLRTNAINQHTFYPYVHSFSNVANREAMLRPISIPDVLPTAIPSGSNFSLVAGRSACLDRCWWLQ